ncbi:hypothetical protein H8R23_04945 [Flavobacterium sp. F-380]|uniref:Uncharacterized protein n=1 Tax=Flavobacterium kayseriense TaxID=2764714 RepID=A0ABR7J5X5_9FLAO|nr:hypothetical protein [Flavobacterium kayseriense]MBC5840744.1 hypothetical protein [Flavobacterium kayseriense]MBC5846586.1 hypothetical protein [Flavobacterium kayseriense]
MIAEKLRILKLKKARIWSEIESLAEVNDSLFLAFGKTQAEIMKLEKQLTNETKNIFDEN